MNAHTELTLVADRRQTEEEALKRAGLWVRKELKMPPAPPVGWRVQVFAVLSLSVTALAVLAKTIG